MLFRWEWEEMTRDKFPFFWPFMHQKQATSALNWAQKRKWMMDWLHWNERHVMPVNEWFRCHNEMSGTLCHWMHWVPAKKYFRWQNECHLKVTECDKMNALYGKVFFLQNDRCYNANRQVRSKSYLARQWGQQYTVWIVPFICKYD